MSDIGCLILNPVLPSTILCQPFLIDTLAMPDCVPTGLGITREVYDEPTFNNAKEIANPGDVIRFVAHPTTGATDLVGYFDWRGDNVSPPAGGAAPATDGASGSHICITADPGVRLVGVNTATPVLDVRGADYIDVINVTTIGGFTGIRMLSVNGDANSRCRIAGCDVSETESSRIVVQGWFTGNYDPSSFVDVFLNEVHTPSATTSTPYYSEGIYVGRGTPRWVDRTNNVKVYANHIHNLTSEGIEIKPGVTSFEVTDNYLHDFNFAFGPGNESPTSAITVLYANLAGAGATTPPVDIPTADGYIARNRIHGLTALNPFSVGYGGLTFESNIGWDYVNHMFRVRTEQPYAPAGVTPQPIALNCNTAQGQLLEVFDPDGFNPVVTQSGNVDQSNPLAYIGPTTGTADAGEGPGSGFAPPAGTTGGAGCTDATGCTGNPAPGALFPSGV